MIKLAVFICILNGSSLCFVDLKENTKECIKGTNSIGIKYIDKYKDKINCDKLVEEKISTKDFRICLDEVYKIFRNCIEPIIQTDSTISIEEAKNIGTECKKESDRLVKLCKRNLGRIK